MRHEVKHISDVACGYESNGLVFNQETLYLLSLVSRLERISVILSQTRAALK